MMLAKKCRIIAILTQDLSNACGALWNFRQIPRKARGDINDLACRYSMLIAASEQCSTCAGTHAGRVVTLIAQQTGRARCREGARQSVSVSVVHASLKTQTNR